MTFTEEQIQEIIRCRDDVEYFLKNYFYVSGPNGPQLMNLRNEEKATLRALQENSKLILDGDRGVGKTTIVTAFLFWRAAFNYHKTNVILTHRMDASKDAAEICKYALAHLPEFLTPSLTYRTQRSFEFENGSKLYFEIAHENACRGRTVDFLFVDEFDLIRTPIRSNMLMVLMPALSCVNSTLVVSSCSDDLAGFRRHDYSVPTFRVVEMVEI